MATDDKSDILDSLSLSTGLSTQHDRSQFLELYKNELESGSSAQEIDQLHLLVKQCLDILRQNWPDLTRAKCREQLIDPQSAQDPAQIEEAIDISLRIWLMIDSRDDSITGYPRHWHEAETIQEVVHSRFPEVPPGETQDINHFPRNFRAIDLERISGIVIQWTTYLDEHLRFDDDNRTLKIFNNKAWLLAVLSSTADEKTSSVVGLPRQLLEETIKTLDVLFPPWHDRTVKFLDDLEEDFYQLPPIPRDLPRLRQFSYWKERLIDVIVEFESPPRSWKHVWRDRRYPMAFWTFWLGLLIFLLTFLFGVVGIVIAGLALQVSEQQQLKQGASGQ